VHDPGGVRLGPPPFTGQWGGGASGVDVAPAPPAVMPPPPVGARPPVLAPPVPLAPPLCDAPGGQPPSGSAASPFGQLAEKMSSESELQPVAQATQQTRKSLEVADIVPFWTRQARLARR
jgi:hypothetical protein